MRVILIDYESIQPTDLAGIEKEDTLLLVFVGAQQHRLPFDFANAMQGLGQRGRYVKIRTSGRNALDFHLAFYLGEITSQYPDGTFRVVSKDGGFDPLLTHLKERGLDVERWLGLSERSTLEDLKLREGLHSATPQNPEPAAQ